MARSEPTVFFDCPVCSKKYKASEDKVGKRLKCRRCGDMLTIPAILVKPLRDAGIFGRPTRPEPAVPEISAGHGPGRRRLLDKLVFWRTYHFKCPYCAAMIASSQGPGGKAPCPACLGWREVPACADPHPPPFNWPESPFKILGFVGALALAGVVGLFALVGIFSGSPGNRPSRYIDTSGPARARHTQEMIKLGAKPEEAEAFTKEVFEQQRRWQEEQRRRGD